MIRLLCLLIIVIHLTACAREGGLKLPGVYRVDVQQGNVIEEEMLLRLKPGMDKNQVRFIMGTPTMIDPFHTGRWEYIYTFSKGGARRDQRHITLHFKDEKLAYVDGDVVPGLARVDEILNKTANTVDVPLRNKKKRGFLRRMLSAIPFIGSDDEPTAEHKDTSKQATKPDTKVDGGLSTP